MTAELTNNSIFDFWAKLAPSDRVHPRDQHVFDRIGPDAHSFNLKCLPSPILGPLRGAPVVLLFLSPGFRPEDEAEARTVEGQKRYVELRSGENDLPGQTPSDWAPRIVKQFEIDWKVAAKKVAILNIGAYKSKTFVDQELLAALPSSRMSISWAQDVLFPEAERGDRVVVCLRSAHFWGLEKGRSKPFGKSLFAPEYARSGFICRKTSSQIRMRKQVVAAVQEAVRR